MTYSSVNHVISAQLEMMALCLTDMLNNVQQAQSDLVTHNRNTAIGGMLGMNQTIEILQRLHSLTISLHGHNRLHAVRPLNNTQQKG